MLIWRYMDFKYGTQSVLEGRFKWAHPNELNDAYEFRGRSVGMFSAKVREEIRKYALSLWKKSPLISPSGQSKRPVQDVNRAVDVEAGEIFNGILMYRRAIGGKMLILCGSDATFYDPNIEQLMWAHYGDRGRGVRVLLNLKSADRADLDVHFIIYKEEMPVVDLSLFKKWMDMDFLIPFFKQCVYTKGIGWSYEHEVRVLTGVNRKCVEKIIKENKEFYFLPIQKEFILCIDFGPLTAKAEVDSFMEKVHADSSLQHLDCRAAQFDLQKYKYSYFSM